VGAAEVTEGVGVAEAVAVGVAAAGAGAPAEAERAVVAEGAGELAEAVAPVPAEAAAQERAEREASAQGVRAAEAAGEAARRVSRAAWSGSFSCGVSRTSVGWVLRAIGRCLRVRSGCLSWPPIRAQLLELYLADDLRVDDSRCDKAGR
jgi:hypothetical protein